MLTGYNTDVSYGGVLFHVQTEDKGINSPIILSLVYRAGTILAAKRTPYSNLIQNGVVDEEAVSQILTRQHQILVAAIQAGKSDKLVELSRHYGEQKSKETNGIKAAVAAPGTVVNKRSPESVGADDSPRVVRRGDAKTTLVGTTKGAPSSISVPARSEQRKFEAVSFDQIITGYLENANYAEQPRLELLYPSKFRAGDEVTVRAALFIGGHKPAPAATIQLQVLGTKIKPQSWQSCTDEQGLVSFNIKIPPFTAGAAALILKATTQNGQDAELKFMISIK